MSGETPSMDFWEAHYTGMDAGWAPRPNAALERVVALQTGTPGRALDVGCGHGGDALWLAGQGWHVTAVDVSPTAVGRTAARAHEAGLSGLVSTIITDLDQETPEGAFDLVTASYFHTPIQIDRAAAIRRVANLVSPSGLLVIVDHASVAPWSWNQDQQVFPAPEQTLATLQLDDTWTPIETAVSSRTATGPAGETATVLDNIIAVRRTA
ncbi:SAM-dependent methyltransferase [Arthrobacter sp. GAS37]